ncbi:hypothetical protein AKJ40_03230 [candidate division MSBL1 archaeon SCGC-AAA259M10]|uniref:Uncharacterized protein n=1 Tax=candidate division MSBL1 archaeon SCGC-AAA259M10 TaxID=1698270 RepID=A0A133UYY9_9EURY|nr:hypothetical protein AKJ40_03230 [candidate division MSBL1 archaeon SCGC-AAA259M10]
MKRKKWDRSDIEDYPGWKRSPNFEHTLPYRFTPGEWERTPLTETDLDRPEGMHGESTITKQFKKLVRRVKRLDLTPQRFLALAISARDSWREQRFIDYSGSAPEPEPRRSAYDLRRYLDAHQKLLGSSWSDRDRFDKALEEVIYLLQRMGFLHEFPVEGREHPLNWVTEKGLEKVVTVDFKEWDQTKTPHRMEQIEACILGAELGCLVWLVQHGGHEKKEVEPDVIWVPPLNAERWDWNRALWVEVDPAPKQHGEKIERQTEADLREGWRVIWITGSDEKLAKIGNHLRSAPLVQEIELGWDSLGEDTDVVLQPTLLRQRSGREMRRSREKADKVRDRVVKALKANWKIYPKEPHRIHIGTEITARQKLGRGEYKTHKLGTVQDYETVQLLRGELAPDELEEREKEAREEREIRNALERARDPSVRIDSGWIWLDGEKKWRATERNKRIVREAV